MALAGDHEVGARQTAGQADQAGHEVEAGLDAGAERDEPAGEAAGRAARRARR